jgi:large repetitive protein
VVPFPTTPGAAQPTSPFGSVAGGTNAFVAKVAPGGASVAVVKSSPNPSVFGEEVTFTATVSPAGVSSNTPTGTIVFDDGQTPIEVLSLTNGSASFNTSALTTGSHNITVTYGGDANFAPSTSTILTQVVDKASTTTTLLGAPNPANVGQTIALTATVTAVSPGAGTPTGTVTFSEGAATLGTGTVSSGVATLNISTLSAGGHTIIASYGGDPNFIASASAGFAQNVILPAAVILVNESVTVTDTPTLMEQAIAVIVVSESITVADAPALLLPAVINVTEAITVTDMPALGPANVSGELSVTSSGLVYSHLTRTFSGTVTVLNTSGQSIAGPIEIVLTNLTAGVTLVNGTGTFVGNPYITVLASGSLPAGQSANVAVRFSDPSNALIHFTPVVYSGSLN